MPEINVYCKLMFIQPLFMFRRLIKVLLLIAAVLVIVYFLGPHPAKPDYTLGMPVVPNTADSLEAYIKLNESQRPLKPDNEARIVWFDSSHKKTEYAIVYLHGFSASQEEGDPVHMNIAKKFGCNLYLSRLAEHGIDTTEPMYNITPDKYWESAKQALAIGQQLGEKVILMGTSTGGTNALQLAAAYPDKIHSLLLMSPNIAINNEKAWLLNNPWGLHIAKAVQGSDHVLSKDQRDIYKKYWYSRYPLKAATELQELLETSMTDETFKKIKQPLLMLYYYKDEQNQDAVVSVPAMLKMFDAIQTPSSLKFKKAIPTAGDHVIGSYIKSKDVPAVEAAVDSFMNTILKLKAAN
jgi:pimeloyl-ACP methyl ester carboxylesterase